LMPDQTMEKTPVAARRFEFARDSLAFANGLIWVYQGDPVTGEMTFNRRQPKPEYSQRCFALARVARQFFYHARFAADQTIANDDLYRQRVRAVIARHPRTPSKSGDQIVIPGFTGLREFSRAQEKLLKSECGGAWRSYFLRSHWRMIFPFSRKNQGNTAKSLAAALGENRLPIVHLVKFPALTINHAIILTGVRETGSSWEFESYDPNNPERPELLVFDRATQTFLLPPNSYWAGGNVNVVHICRSFFF